LSTTQDVGQERRFRTQMNADFTDERWFWHWFSWMGCVKG